MQTKNYGELFTFIQALIGPGTLAIEECRIVHQFINQRLSQGYNTTQSWPRYLTPSEKRNINQYTLSEATSSTSTSVNQNYILLGDNDGDTGKLDTKIYQGVTTSSVIIYKNDSNAWIVATGATTAIQSNGKYRITGAGTTQFTEADTDKKAALEQVEVFTPRAGSDVLVVERKNLIPYAETNKDTIGEFVRIHRKKAFLNQSQLEYDFFIDVDGANILNSASSDDKTAFVTYKKQLTDLTITEGGTPNPSNYTDNTSQKVPLEFYNFIANGAYADFLRVERRFSEAQAAEAAAQNYLAQELEKLDIIANNNNLKKKFSTHLNRNSR
jgi:hypothetical protein